jgi:hypothetical protein
MAKLRLTVEATAESDRTATHPAYAEAELELSITLPDGLSESASERIQLLLNRELTRAAQIAAVDLKDQQTAAADTERLKDLPRERPLTVLGAGSKDDNARQQFFQEKDGSVRELREGDVANG